LFQILGERLAVWDSMPLNLLKAEYYALASRRHNALVSLQGCVIYDNQGQGQGDDFTYDDATLAEVPLDTLIEFANNIWEFDWKELLFSLFNGTVYDLYAILYATPGSPLRDEVLEAYRVYLESYLIVTLNDTLKNSPYGEAMARRFIAGLGGEYIHDQPTNGLVVAVSNHRAFKELVENIKRELEKKLQSVASSTLLDCSYLSPIAIERFPRFDPLDIPLGFPIGGTQGLSIKLISFRVDPVARVYDGYLEVTIYDDFGVGKIDLYAGPLIAFWILQHVKEIPGNHRPFVNKIVVQTYIQGGY
jgi:hypothetical protein